MFGLGEIQARDNRLFRHSKDDNQDVSAGASILRLVKVCPSGEPASKKEMYRNFANLKSAALTTNLVGSRGGVSL